MDGLSLGWTGNSIRAVDQRALPGRLVELDLRTVDELVDAIAGLAIRGAPSLGIAGAMGVALSARLNAGDTEAVLVDAKRIGAVRPTAVQLARGVERALHRLPEGPDAVAAEAVALLVEDARVSRAAAGRAADVIVAACPDRPLRLLTHCNTGRFATASRGTALGAIAELAERGRVQNVLVDETRPLLQGARLTTWELADLGIAHELCVDSAAAAAMADGLVDCVVVGADRVVANGDVANKVGTYGLAVAAARHGIPFVVVATENTIDTRTATGARIVVEQRDADEVRRLGGHELAPADTPVHNPAFDITPADLVTAVVTEDRVFGESPAALAARVVAALRRRDDDVEDDGSPALDGVYADPELFNAAVRSLAARLRSDVDLVVAVQPSGAALAAGLAGALGVGFATIAGAAASLRPGVRACLVAELVGTGSSLAAAATIIRATGAEVVAAAALVGRGPAAGRSSGAIAQHTVARLP